MIPILVNPFCLLLCSCINPCCIPMYLLTFLLGSSGLVLSLLVICLFYLIQILLNILLIFCIIPLSFICLIICGPPISILFAPVTYSLLALYYLLAYLPTSPCLSSLLTTLQCTRDLPTIFSRLTCGLVNIFEPIYTVEDWFKNIFRTLDKNVSSLLSSLSGKVLDHCLPAQCFGLSIRSCISCSPYNLICRSVNFLSG